MLSCESDREPVDFTHFDQWEAPESIDSLERVLSSWENSLGCELVSLDGFGSFECMVSAVGFDNTFSLILFNILNEGYDVYSGDNFIEIYSNEELP